MKKRLMATILAIAILFTSCIVFRTSSYASTLTNKKSSLESELQRLKNDKAAAAKSLAEAKNKADEQDKVVKLMYEEIEICQKELDAISALIDEYFALAKEKEQEIEEINARMEKNFELFRRRLVFAQESGDMTLIDFILGSSDISDILSRAEQVNDMLEYDRKLIESLANDKQELEAAKAEIDEALEKCAQQQDEYEIKLAEIQEKAKQADALLEQLRQDQSKQQEYLNALNAQASAKEKELDNVNAQIRQSQTANNSSGSSGSSGNGGSNVSGGVTTDPISGTSNFGWIWPISTAYRHAISQYFKGAAHSGLDIHTYGVNDRVPALAVGAGKVVRCGYFASWGNLVVVQHPNGWQTYYAHLARILVSNGQQVSQGQQLGLIGTTGNSTGPHLHICVVTPAGQRVNPLDYLPH